MKFDRRAGLTALVLLLVTLLVQLGLIWKAPQSSAYIYGFPFPFVALTVPGALQNTVFFAALGKGVTGWALYPLSLVVDAGLWFLLYFVAMAAVLPLLPSKKR